MQNMEIRRGKNYFRENADVRVGRSQFDRSCGRKMTFDASYLYPIFLDPVWPGDTFKMSANGIARILSPLDAPIFDNIEVEMFFFFVPMRHIWSNWENFMGYHDSAGAQDTTYTIPVLDSGMTVAHESGVADEHLAAYLGLPDGLNTANTTVSALPFRAYDKVISDWFRDQNVAAEAIGSAMGNGPDAPSAYALIKSCKKHDYFTSALPYLQKGDAQGLSFDDLPVLGIGALDQTPSLTPGGTIYESDGGSTTYAQAYATESTSEIVVEATAAGSAYPKVFADMSGVTITVNALRESVAIQRLLEQRARGGTRYVEVIKAQFGVTSPDFRLQRSEYLGGGRSYIHVQPVANATGVDSANSVSGSDEPQGELSGVGVGSIRGGFAKSFTEHGYIIGLIRARGDLTYFQGVDRHWTYSSEFDFYTPALAHLGEQAILNKELYVTGTPATDDAVFGYQERWAELRFKKSEVVGLFNPDATGALSHWHLAEDFSTTPTLNTAFIYDQTPMSRVTTVDSVPDFLLDIWFDLKCARPLPAYSVPSLTGRF